MTCTDRQPYRLTILNRLRSACLILPCLAGVVVPAYAQVAGQSVNMVTGTQWPTGDPFLERQNEPSMAVSSRNPLHLMAGNNDYRTVDLPGVPCPTASAGQPTPPCKPTGDAWLGVFTAVDGGNTWTSTLLPGYPQDQSAVGDASPLHAYTTGADPSVRAGTNGMFYYGGLVFNRDSSGSAIFLARYIDGNNVQGANTVKYLDAHIVATGNSTNFLDKPAIAVDMPRSGEGSCSIPASADGSVPASSIPAGNIYVAYTQFVGPESSNISAIMFSQSKDCGVTWSTPVQVSKMIGTQKTNQGAALAIDPVTGNVYVVWRIFKGTNQLDALAGVAWQYSSKTFTNMVNKPIYPFDQGTSDISFRTNAYPSIAVDAAGVVYVGWAERGLLTNTPSAGDSRIWVISGKPIIGSGTQIIGMQFSLPTIVDNYSGRGHQIMPALAYSSGKLTVAWYDFRDDDQIAVYNASGGGKYAATEELPSGVTPAYSTYISDPVSPYKTTQRRHTVDVRAAQAVSGAPPAFKPSILVSQYTYGSPAFDPGTADNLAGDSENIQQLDFDAPNLPLFQLGTVPFVGDYIDVAGPTFIPVISGGVQTWRFNNLASDPDQTHVVWTDNRNVVQPADGNWANYTPVGVTGGPSTFNPSLQAPVCSVGQTGIRNQDIYTATVSPGIIMGAKGNFIQPTSGSTATTREYPVTVQNTTGQTVYYLLTIQNQPASGSASFLQYPVSGLPNPMTQLQIGIPPYSSSSRSVFIASTLANPAVSVNAAQADVNYNLIPGGMASTTALNSDTSNPNISNPNISNVELYNPNISNPNISNPNISNPNISNPNISNPNISNLNVSNPNISNVSFANPNISNPNISNPNISNPNISNPNISNPNISNTAISGEITDVNYAVTNSGNTATAYSLTLLQYAAPPQGVSVQLIVSGVYFTPVANGCSLAVQANYNPIVSVPNPTFTTVGGTLASGPPSPLAPSFTLQPGEQAVITLRVFDSTATTPQQALKDYNPAVAIAPVVVNSGINTNLPRPVAGVPVKILAITSTALPQLVAGGSYSTTLAASGGMGTYTWTAVGALPEGLSLSAAGVLSGTIPVTGTYTLTAQVSDMGGQTTQRLFTLIALPALAITTASLPNGQFNGVYSATLAASGGIPPYSWTLAPNAVLPAGMSISQAGVVSGAPGQAGVWTVPVTVTDSAHDVSTANFPLGVGLAVGYSGGNNCYMPYPATPLYPSSATWTVNTSSLPAAAQSQFYILQGNVLTGCLSRVNSGNYTLGLTPSTGSTSLNIPLRVVGQGNMDNGTYYVNSGGVGNLPPSGYQQGVVASGQQFTYSPGIWGADSGNFNGNFLFGFNGGAPQTCLANAMPGSEGPPAPSNVSLTSPAQPARYDVIFDGTTQTCSQATTFPASPAAIVIDSVDTIPTTPVVNNATITGVTLSSTASYVQTQNASNVLDVLVQPTGTTFPVTVSFTYSLTQEDYCPGCIDQVEVGLNTDPGPQACAYSGLTPAGPTASNITLNVPNTPGRYYVSFDRSQQYSCITSSWTFGAPNPARYIAIVDVWQFPSGIDQ